MGKEFPHVPHVVLRDKDMGEEFPCTARGNGERVSLCSLCPFEGHGNGRRVSSCSSRGKGMGTEFPCGDPWDPMEGEGKSPTSSEEGSSRSWV